MCIQKTNNGGQFTNRVLLRRKSEMKNARTELFKMTFRCLTVKVVGLICHSSRYLISSALCIKFALII